MICIDKRSIAINTGVSPCSPYPGLQMHAVNAKYAVNAPVVNDFSVCAEFSCSNAEIMIVVWIVLLL